MKCRTELWSVEGLGRPTNHVTRMSASHRTSSDVSHVIRAGLSDLSCGGEHHLTAMHCPRIWYLQCTSASTKLSSLCCNASQAKTAQIMRRQTRKNMHIASTTRQGTPLCVRNELYSHTVNGRATKTNEQDNAHISSTTANTPTL